MPIDASAGAAGLSWSLAVRQKVFAVPKRLRCFLQPDVYGWCTSVNRL